MDFLARAIERNREALLAIIAALLSMLALDGDGKAARSVRRAVLRVLRPAESAVRRLIVIAARDVVVKPRAGRPLPAGGVARKGGRRAPRFPLFDPRKQFFRKPRAVYARVAPRAYFLDLDTPSNVKVYSTIPEPPPAPLPSADPLADCRRLRLRLEFVQAALADLPRQAVRLARARLRRAKVPRLRLMSPMRPGRPPGYRKRRLHEVDDVLSECHALAHEIPEFAPS